MWLAAPCISGPAGCFVSLNIAAARALPSSHFWIYGGAHLQPGFSLSVFIVPGLTVHSALFRVFTAPPPPTSLPLPLPTPV